LLDYLLVVKMALAECAMYAAAYAITTVYIIGLCMAWLAVIRGVGGCLRRLAQ